MSKCPTLSVEYKNTLKNRIKKNIYYTGWVKKSVNSGVWCKIVPFCVQLFWIFAFLNFWFWEKKVLSIFLVYLKKNLKNIEKIPYKKGTILHQTPLVTLFLCHPLYRCLCAWFTVVHIYKYLYIWLWNFSLNFCTVTENCIFRSLTVRISLQRLFRADVKLTV